MEDLQWEPSCALLIYPQAVRPHRVSTNAREPVEDSSQAQAAEDFREGKPEWVELSHQKKTVLPLGLIKGHEKSPPFRCFYGSTPVLCQNIPSLHGLEGSESGQHPKPVPTFNWMAVLQFQDPGKAFSGCQEELAGFPHL